MVPGKLVIWAGIPIPWLYPLLFLFDRTNLGDLKFLVPTTILPRQPLEWIENLRMYGS